MKTLTETTQSADSAKSNRLPLLSNAATTRGLQPDQLHPLARTSDEWGTVLKSWGERSFHARQVFRWIHAKGVLDPAHMTDISKSLRQRLTEDHLAEVVRLVHVQRSLDNTRKLLVGLSDGHQVECVLIPMTSKSPDEDVEWGDPDEWQDEDPREPLPVGDESSGDALLASIRAGSDQKKCRVTLCVSTQFGCAMGCVFCASGQFGLGRGLGAAEIVAQVIEARRHLDDGEILTNLVFMGMGEPLHHYEETARALRLLSDNDGVGLGLRRMTVSTVGLIRGIERLGQDFAGKVGLAISLHAPNDALRSQIVPMNERIGLSKLIAALRNYPLPRRRRITIEYILIAGVNDQRVHARELAQLLRPLRVKVNLISMNTIEGSKLTGSSLEQVEQFREWVANEGYSCFIRRRRGDDVSAACGQLALRENPVE
ncbi:MAG TPA: 23S rRNA (adenine(2503)-C(2))-methyltransferase RlmN [Polyangiaceae bacterium]